MESAPPQERIERLLHQLENPRLSDEEIDRIERKIEILRKSASSDA